MEKDLDNILSRISTNEPQNLRGKFPIDNVMSQNRESMMEEGPADEEDEKLNLGLKIGRRKIPLKKIVKVEDVFEKNMPFFKEASETNIQRNEATTVAANHIVPKPFEADVDDEAELSSDSEDFWDVEEEFAIDKLKQNFMDFKIGGSLLLKEKKQQKIETPLMVQPKPPLSKKTSMQKVKEKDPDTDVLGPNDFDFQPMENVAKNAVRKPVNDEEPKQAQPTGQKGKEFFTPIEQIETQLQQRQKKLEIRGIRSEEVENEKKLAEKLTNMMFEDRVSLAFSAFKTATQRELFDGPNGHGASENLLPKIFDYTFAKAFDFDKDELRNFAQNFKPAALATVFAKIAEEFSKCKNCFLPFRVHGMKWKTEKARLGGKKDDISVIFNILLDLKPPSDEVVQEFTSQLHKKEDTVAAALKAHVGLFMDFYSAN